MQRDPIHKNLTTHVPFLASFSQFNHGNHGATEKEATIEKAKNAGIISHGAGKRAKEDGVTAQCAQCA